MELAVLPMSPPHCQGARNFFCPHRSTRQKTERPPRARRPFHCQAANLPPKPFPAKRRGSSSRQAAENDNETLDHLLSIWLREENIAARAQNGKMGDEAGLDCSDCNGAGVAGGRGRAVRDWLGRESVCAGRSFRCRQSPARAGLWTRESSWARAARHEGCERRGAGGFGHDRSGAARRPMSSSSIPRPIFPRGTGTRMSPTPRPMRRPIAAARAIRQACSTAAARSMRRATGR